LIKKEVRQEVDVKKILKKIKSWEKTISVFLGIAVILVAGALIFDFFRSQGSNSSTPEISPSLEEEILPSRESASLPAIYKVKEGDNLWKIAEKYYHSGYNWVDIAKENNLRNPDLLLVGREIKIPDVPVRYPQGQIAGGESRTHIDHYQVVKGDSLWKIAVKVYGDGYQWTKIYEANQDKIGPNPGLIFSGTNLLIP